jgi:hypothetical protein
MRLIKGYQIKVDRFCVFYLRRNPKKFKTFISSARVKRIVEVLAGLDSDKYVTRMCEELDSGLDCRNYYIESVQLDYRFGALLEIKRKKARQLWLALNG